MSAPVTVGGCALHMGDCREVLPTLPAETVHCCVTSPPYWGLRDYGCAGQIGLEASVAEYVAELVGVFREVRRVLRDDGTVFLNLGDAYFGSSQTGGTNSIEGSAKRAGRMFSRRVASQRATNRSMSGTSSSGLAYPNYTTAILKPKDLIGLPWRVAFAIQADGWWLRSDIIWAKPNPMPESVQDRPTRSHEYVFMLSKSASYYFDAEAVREPNVGMPADREARTVAPKGNPNRCDDGGRNRVSMRGGQALSYNPAGRNVRSVWNIATQPFAEAHFATMPAALAERCIKAGCPVGGTVLDPFAGAATTLMVADRLQRRSVGIELSPTYCAMAAERLRRDAPLFAGASA